MTDTNTKMNMVTEMPTEGQFATLHEFAGKLWGSTYKWEGEDLLEYNTDSDEWVKVEDFDAQTAALDILGYYVAVEA